MSLIFLALPLLFQQNFGDSDTGATRFHRVHLRNGNFIDGAVIKSTSVEVLLRIRSGEMGIRLDQIERVEIIEPRGVNALARTFELSKPTKPDPVKPADVGVKPPDNGGKTPRVNPTADKVPADVRKKIDSMVFKLRTAAGEKSFPIGELEKMGDDAVIYLAARLPDFDPNTSALAVAALINLKNPVANPILEGLLSHEGGSVRASAATVLGVLGGEPEKAKYLRPLLSDKDASVRGTILGLLGSVEDQEWIDPIADLCGETVKDIRNQALNISSRLSKKYGVEEKLIRVLGGNLGNSDDGVRADNAAAIGGLGKQDSWSLLTPLLNDSEARVRGAAAQGLMALAAPDSGPDILTAMSREKERWARIYLAGVAQKLRLFKASEFLIDWLTTEDEDVRKVASDTLRTLTGENFGQDREKWSDWWSKNKK
jgi:HEAT repeat protein